MWKFLRCFFGVHFFKEQYRRFTPPVSRGVKVTSGSSGILTRLTFGFTTIELKCQDCGQLVGKLMDGDQRC